MDNQLVSIGKTDKGYDLYLLDLESYYRNMNNLGYLQEQKHDHAVLCPICSQKKLSENPNYSKLKLWINKDFNFGRCFVCNSVFVSPNDKIEKGYVTKYRSNMSKFTVSHLNHEYWTYELFNSMPSEDEVGLEYLSNRHKYLEKLSKILGFRFLDHNPVIPFYYRGELIYYQLRMIDPRSEIKYFSPPIDNKPAYIIDHKENKKFIICEGVFDAIACLLLYPEYTPFAVLGSSITDYQIWMLRSYVPEEIIIYMDDTELSKNIRKSISKYLDYADMKIIKSNGEDPEELLKKKILLGEL